MYYNQRPPTDTAIAIFAVVFFILGFGIAVQMYDLEMNPEPPAEKIEFQVPTLLI